MSKCSGKVKAAKRVQRFGSRDVTLTATPAPNYLSDGWSHIELRVVRPKGIPLPITGTGYLSHFLSADDLEAAGGPADFFRA